MAKHGVRFKPEQIVSVLRQIEVLTANGKGLDEACKTLTITPQSYYRWRKMYGGMKAQEIDCRSSSARSHASRGPQGKLLSPTKRKNAAQLLMSKFRVSERTACGLVGLSRTAFRYMPLPRDDEDPF